MYTGLLHLHSFLRWVILILLLIGLVQAYTAKSNPDAGAKLKKTSLFLLISAHTTFLIGLYQWIVGPWGLKNITNLGMSAVMKDDVYRFFAVEHLTGMLIAIVLITIARGKVKKAAYGAAFWLYFIALVIILVSIPWPGRMAGAGRGWI
ncbi:hypothetical protein QEG73_16945 [Chitinophagaceae bacterium 26-R-25]|nr:hypothetical protein [Chitinophagaceae bacterium 26-R-25]